MCKRGSEVVVRLAQPRPGSGRTEVPVDACLSALVQMLNDYGVHTIGCCCGHGRGPSSVIYVVRVGPDAFEEHEMFVTAPAETPMSDAEVSVEPPANVEHEALVRLVQAWQEADLRTRDEHPQPNTAAAQQRERLARNDLNAWRPHGFDSQSEVYDPGKALTAAALSSPVGETPAPDDDKCPIDGGDTSDGACSICRITQAALVNMCHHCDEQPPDKLCWWCGRRGTAEPPATEGQ